MNTTLFSTRLVTAAADSERPPSPRDRALVLGGGGSTGNAWVIGVVAGLLEGGLDVTDADLVIGTSAGSTAAAQITGAGPTGLLADILDTGTAPPAGPAGAGGGRGRVGQAADLMERTAAIIAAAQDPADMRRRLGAAMLEWDAASDGSGHERWRATVAGRLPARHWPEQRLLLVAVDARTGEPVAFDRYSGVDLVDAIAASTSNGFAYRIGESRFINGGYRRSSENADLAAGYGRVLVLSPFGGRTRTPPAWGMDLAAEVDELRTGGSRVETVFPGAAAERMFGAAAMDLSLRAPAARAGHEQGLALAPALAAFWH